MTAEEKIYEFLLTCHRVFYLATSEENVPDIRPFGAVILFDGHAVFCTGRDKKVYRQIQANPNISLCACYKGVRWMRAGGQAQFIKDDEAKQKMLSLESRLRKKYGEDGEGLELFRICHGRVSFSERGKEDEVLEF